MEKIRELLIDTRPEYDFLDSVDFIEAGMLDSFDVITIVADLDEMFGISIDGEDIVPKYFSSIESLKELVLKNGGVL